MAQVYALKINGPLSEHLYHLLIKKTAGEKRNKIQRFFRKEDALRCLFADLLIRYVLMQHYGLENKSILFEYTVYGKPYLAEADSIHFNVSHSGEWVVCVTDEKPVGIDIELITSIDLQIADKYFSTNENRQLLALEPADRFAFFYELWTLKESYLKMKGEGLSIPLDSFTVFIDKQRNILLESETDGQATAFFKQYNVDKRYKMAVCASADAFRDVVILSMQEINVFFESVTDAN